jgi:hypothetical protein
MTSDIGRYSRLNNTMTAMTKKLTLPRIKELSEKEVAMVAGGLGTTRG